ncbi:conserved hypothetical protein [Halomonas korlensis]|uniref:Lysylphosphatidylglycerol synthase TM region n=1 Tax=Halomonas korlensis TaxID=463301 RepID=A0A1I7FZQ2_9GAMM|nr:conserved hypothetical protein [Halomonas korlensis]
MSNGGSRWRRLRPVTGLLLLATLWWWLEPADILAEVQSLSTGWALLALALTLPPLLLSAWRWRLTARLLDLSLGWRRAVREYYLALFLNQLLPGGVAGDAARAWRHSKASGRQGSAWRAVIIERASGQLAMVLLTLLVVGLSPLWHGVLGEALSRLFSPSWFVGGIALALALGVVMRRLVRRPPAFLEGLGADLHRSLLASSVWPKHLLGSLLVVISYALVFVCAARAIGVPLPATTLLSLVPPVLLAMLIPVSVAGWGVREGAAAFFWGLAGLPPAQGVAVSMAYGLLVLIAALPGAMCLLQAKWSRPVGGESSGTAGTGEIQIEEGVVAATERARYGAQRLVERRDGCHDQAGASGADQQRRDQQVQAVEHAGLEKARHGDAAAFDQHPLEAALREGAEHGGGGKAALAHGQGLTADMPTDWPGGLDAFAMQMQGRRRSVLKQLEVARHPSARVEDDAHRLGAGHVAHGELRVVLAGGAGAHHDRLHQGAQPVKMDAAFQPIDVMRMAAFGSDAPVEALAELGHGHASRPVDQRGKAVEQLAGRFADARRTRIDSAGRRRCVSAVRRGLQQGLPRRVEGSGNIIGGHRGSGPGRRPHHA